MLKDAAGQLMGGRGRANCCLWLAGGRPRWWEGLRAGTLLGGQLLVSCGAGGCNWRCAGGGPARRLEPHCPGVRALSPAGLLSQALRVEEKTGRSRQKPACYQNVIVTDMNINTLSFSFLPVSIKAHVSMRRSAGRQVFRRTGLPLHFADRRSMKHHCKHAITFSVLHIFFCA